jgi:hypothetical protein
MDSDEPDMAHAIRRLLVLAFSALPPRPVDCGKCGWPMGAGYKCPRGSSMCEAQKGEVGQ